MAFKKGQSGNPKGRPKGYRGHVRDACWKSLDKVIKCVFETPEPELEAWLVENLHTLSRAERVLIEESNNPIMLNSILDRVCGRPMPQIDEDSTDKTINIIL